ncbi:hypothetical protein [Specibacter cremeus]|uniref:hypothetical protein n=1 Tax=Specibacter cremeus TaxID=1629051 RepID=UPI000F76663C|nr:hypothetical protein [Specibacter cremeus]
MCAGIAFASIAVHLWMAWAHRGMPFEAALMVLMAAACLPCALSVWRGAHGRAVHLLMAMALAMAAVHAVLLLGPGLAGHTHAGMAMGGISPTGAATGGAGMLGVIALELVVGASAAALLRRRRAYSRRTCRS